MSELSSLYSRCSVQGFPLYVHSSSGTNPAVNILLSDSGLFGLLPPWS